MAPSKSRLSNAVDTEMPDGEDDAASHPHPGNNDDSMVVSTLESKYVRTGIPKSLPYCLVLSAPDHMLTRLLTGHPRNARLHRKSLETESFNANF